jgi:hypothetical protein
VNASGSIREVGPFIVVTGYEDSLDLYDALLSFYVARRPRRVTTWGTIYPETNVNDVLMVRGQLAKRLAEAPPDRLGLAATRTRWQLADADVQRATAGKLLHDIYPDNASFWREARRLAVDLSASAALPTKVGIVTDAIKASVTSVDGVVGDVLDVGERIVTGAADAVVGASKAIASGAKDVVKGGVEGVGDAVIKPLVDAVGKPLLIGAAVLGGLLIVPKLIGNERSAA